MHSDLVDSQHYGLINFISTTHALKAEKVLKSFGAEFVVMPTLREISASCGMSIKLAADNLQPYFAQLIANDVQVGAAYEVEKVGNENRIKRLALEAKS